MIVQRKRRLTKHSLVIDLLDHKPRAGRKYADKDVQVEEKRHPRGRLVLGHRRNNRNVDFSIARVPQRIEPTAPRCHITCTARYSSVLAAFKLTTNHVNRLRAEMSTGYTWPSRSNLAFLNSDIRALWRSRMSEITNVG